MEQLPIKSMIVGKTKLTNQHVLDDSPSMICADFKDFQPSKKFTRVTVELTG
jgi:hypothetical protein